MPTSAWAGWIVLAVLAIVFIAVLAATFRTRRYETDMTGWPLRVLKQQELDDALAARNVDGQAPES